MKLKSLKAENFASYRDETIDFSQLNNGPVLLTGNNGCGKSTILEMITIAIYNKCRNCEKKGISIDDLITTGEDHFKIELTFEQNDDEYTIIREKNKKSQKLKLLVNGEEKKGKLTEIQNMINSIVKLDYDTFMDTVVISQGEADNFMKKSPLDRKKVIAKILHLDKYDKLEAKTKEIRKEMKMKLEIDKERIEKLFNEIKNKNNYVEKIKQLNNEISKLQFKIDSDDLELEKVLSEKAKYEQLKNQQNILINQKRSIDEKITNIKNSIQKGMNLLNSINEIIKDKDAVYKEIELENSNVDNYISLDKNISSEISGLKSENRMLENSLNDLKKKSFRLKEYGDAICEFCGQEITDEYKESHLNEMRKQAKELKEKIDSNSNLLNELNKKLNENSKNLSNLKQRINKLNEKRSKIEQGLVKKDNYENRLKELNEELENYQKEKEQFENMEIVEVEEKHFNDFELKSNLRNNREKLNRITSEVSVINNELDKIKEKEKEYDDLNEKNKKNIKVYNRYGELQKAWSKDGIQALIIDTTLPLIEAEINNYLNIMSAGEISIKFETQKEAKNGNISETLDIIVSDFSCSDRKYELFSGGQKQRINLAIRVGLSKFLSNRSNSDIQFFFIDEGLSTLDDDGRANFLEMIGAISQMFEQIFIISHMEDVKDAFEQKILITKTQDEGSKIRIMK